MPRHARDPRFSARETEASPKVNKRSSSLVVIENEFILPAQRPSLQDFSGLRVYRNCPRLLCLRCKDIQNVLFQIHVRPSENEKFPSAQSRVQGETNQVLKKRCSVSDEVRCLLGEQLRAFALAKENSIISI